ncbi:MAG: 50S ribosomal protein L4 [Eubacteriales bacterium]|nr:50S ribosomal protein L4 [Eubacteriales bacterium]
MAKVDVLNKKGEVTGQIELNDQIFGIQPDVNAMHLVVRQQLANRRQGTSATKGRSQRRGGGRKPWRQKGTGRARQGSIRAAQWVGGGIIFGPSPRDYSFSVNKKVKRLALKSAFSSKLQDSKLFVVEDLDLAEIKTKELNKILAALKLNNVFVVESEYNKNLLLSGRNLVGVKTATVNEVNVFDLLKYDALLMTKKAAEKIQEVYQ